MIVVSFDDLVLIAEDCIGETEGFIEVSYDCGVGSNKTVAVSTEFVVVALHFVVLTLDDVVSCC